jgi:hypothetical protein
MARQGRPERNRTARSFRQLRRFHHIINSDKVFGTHSVNKPVKFFINENYNHFEMTETFASPYGLLGREVLEQMQLRGA